MSNTLSIGKIGEDEAVKYLIKQGYKIIERNFRSRNGEIDIIAMDHDTLVFIEVKLRSSNFWGEPLEAINHFKLNKIIKTLYYYLSTHKSSSIYRIDAVEIVYSNNKFKINHIKNISL